MGLRDSTAAIGDPELRRQLLWLRANYWETVDSRRLGKLLRGFRSQKGIYKPRGSPHALWVRETLRGPYPDQKPEFSPDGSWTYRYAPEGRQGRPDMSLDTNRALLRCATDRIPVGVLRQTSALPGSSSYEILGLAYVEEFNGVHFVLRGEPIRWEIVPSSRVAVGPFQPFETEEGRVSRRVQRLRDHRFGVVIRMAYHERCSLCEVGYRVRGRLLGLEAGHIIPVKDRGTSSDIRNGMLLCRNHHALFDEFAWTPDEDLRVIVVDDEGFRRSAAANCILDWEGKRLPNLPDRRELQPAPEAVKFRLERFQRS